MSSQLSTAGVAGNDLARKAHRCWQEVAAKNNVNLGGFDPDSSLGDRMAWALRTGLSIATVYSRFSSKRQHSTDDQIRECVVWAARNGMYVPPELICIDEAVKGKRIRRDGLDRMKQILQARYATVLLVFKASRLFRQAFKGFQMVQEEVVEEGLRAVSVSQGIDTDDKKSWKVQLQAHGLVDDLLLDAIADHARAGLTGLHLNGWTTGAIGVGYRRKEIPDAPLTNRGLPRTAPEVDPEAAELIRKHVRWHLDGMPLKEGWRRWVAAGGPCDPRSTTGRMSYSAYRRLLSNVRLTGRWEFGRKRNQFSTKLDYVKQIEQPDSEVAIFQCEELRILDDETFLALQAWLKKFKHGPRGRRKQKRTELWDLTTDIFHCAQCSKPDEPVRFYQTGANGKGMQCKNGDLCPCKSAVRREEAVRAVCERLVELIQRDTEKVVDAICHSRESDLQEHDEMRELITSLEEKIRKLTARIDDLYTLSGQGSKDDRSEVLARIRSAQSERATAQLDLTRAQKALDGTASALKPEDVRRILAEITGLLSGAAAGNLSEDLTYKAATVFRRLTGEHIRVHVERRKGRKQTNVRGVFQAYILRAVKEHDGQLCSSDENPSEEVSVWLRKPPRLEAIAQRVHELIDIEGLSYREAAKQLQKEGHNVNSGNVWYSYRRWYEMQGLPVPKLRYNNGHRRKSA